jgi:hypothetical protein
MRKVYPLHGRIYFGAIPKGPVTLRVRIVKLEQYAADLKEAWNK